MTAQGSARVVLLVDLADADLVREMEASQGDPYRFRVVHATRMSDAVDILGHDAIDVHLARFGDAGFIRTRGAGHDSGIGRRRADRHTLGDYGASPRDLVDVHIAALSRSVEDSISVKARTLAVEGRLPTLEMMGLLVDYYRVRNGASPR